MAKENTSKRSRIFLDPLLKANPLFVMVLGTCPALAVTTSFESAIGMGLLFTFVVFFSNLLISALRKVIPEEVETPAYIVIIATFVTIVKILTSTFLPELYNSLGVFVSLLVVNCIVLGRAEAFANKNGVVDSMLDGLGNGLGYTWAIAVIALFREVVGAGTLTFGKTFTFIPQITIPILGGFKGTNFSLAIPLFKSSAGGFLVLGFALAILAAVNNYKKHKAQEALKAQKAKEAEARKAALAAKAAAKSATAAEGGK